MNVSEIKPSGSSHVLKWAIKGGANILADVPLQSLINDETFFMVTLEDVNFFEMFRLTQKYREKLRVLNTRQTGVPDRKNLVAAFPGEISDPQNEEDKIPLYQIAEHAANMFMNLYQQMNADEDIIRREAVRLFIPMICRRYDVQIPLGFMDMISFFKSEEEFGRVFNLEYPATLQREIVDAENSSVRNGILFGMVQMTSINRYPERYTDLMNLTKYWGIQGHGQESPKLYKFTLLSFWKYDNVAREQVRCDMFQPVPDEMKETMQRLNRVNTPLMLDFALQIPIQAMQNLENRFSDQELHVGYESSMKTIIDDGIRFEDFITPAINPETEDEEERVQLDAFTNQVSAYKVRINEANQALLAAIYHLTGEENREADINTSDIFSLLPAIYMTRAVITVDSSKISTYENVVDPMLAEMFSEMESVCVSLNDEINETR